MGIQLERKKSKLEHNIKIDHGVTECQRVDRNESAQDTYRVKMIGLYTAFFYSRTTEPSRVPQHAFQPRVGQLQPDVGRRELCAAGRSSLVIQETNGNASLCRLFHRFLIVV